MFDPFSTGPSSMPLAVPGAVPPGPTGNLAPLPAGPPPMPPGPPPGPPPVGSPMGGPATGFPPMPMDPSSMQYDAETQSDGTILLRIKGPDGSPGPVVQLIPPPKMKGAKAAQ